MARASKRAGYGKQRGSTNQKSVYAPREPSQPLDGDRWLNSLTMQEYIYDKATSQWIPIFGGYGKGIITGLVWNNTNGVTTVSSLQTVAYVTAVTERTSTVVMTSCINGNASTTMSVTSYVRLNTTTVNTLVKTIDNSKDEIITISLPIENVPSGINDIWVQQTVDIGNWVLNSDEQHIHVMSFYEAIISQVEIGYIFAGKGPTALRDTDEFNTIFWRSNTNMPSPARYWLGSSTINSIAYVYGGYTGSISLQDCDEYNPDTWTSKTDMPTPARTNTGATYINSKGYVFCGYSTDFIQDCDEYSPSDDTWKSKLDSPSPARDVLTSCTI